MPKSLSRAAHVAILWACVSCTGEVDWPARGKSDLAKAIQNAGDANFRCYNSDWMKTGNRTTAVPNYPDIRDSLNCKIADSELLWRHSNYAVAATFRCEDDKVVAEYTVTIFNIDDPYGGYYCSLAYFPSAEKYPIGSVTDWVQVPF